MFRCALTALVAVSLVAPAAGQSRAFPQNTLRGAMVFRDDGQVLLNGQVVPLSPGSRVRDQRNMIVLAASLVGAKFLVNYTLDIGGGQVRDVWVLRPEEAAVRPWPTTLQESQTWTYDPATMTWIKP